MKKKSKTKPINSRAKGARGELEAAKYLTKIGFPCGRMGRNGYSDADLKGLEKCLPKVHIEVKFGVRGMDVGTKLLEAAWEQAASGAGWWNETPGAEWERMHSGSPEPIVLWKPPRKPWRLTWHNGFGLVTICGDTDIRAMLLELNG